MNPLRITPVADSNRRLKRGEYKVLLIRDRGSEGIFKSRIRARTRIHAQNMEVIVIG